MFLLIYITVNIKTVILYLECMHRDVCATDRCHRQQAVWEAATICPHPLQVDLLTLKVVSKSRVTWATPVPILVFLFSTGPMYTIDRRQTRIIA